MENEEYTLLSSKEVSELKQDIDYLKKNPLGGSKEGKTLLESIEKLNENIGQLIDIFKEASETMKAEERESEVIAKRIEPIEKKLEELSDQNQKIAKGILAVADMVSAKEEEKVPQSIPRPVAPMMPRPMPQPQMQRPMSPQGMPQPMTLPPPPRKEEKKGLFGFKK